MYCPQKSHFFSVRTNPNPFCTSLQLLLYRVFNCDCNEKKFYSTHMPCPIVLNLSFSYWEMSDVFSALLFDIFEASLVFLKKNFLLMLASNSWQNALRPHQHLLRKTNHSLPFLFLGIYKSRFPMKKTRFIWKSFLMRHRSSCHDLEEIRHGQLLEKCKIGLKME